MVLIAPGAGGLRAAEPVAAPSEVNALLLRRYATTAPQIEQATRAVEQHQFAEANRILASCLQQVPDHFQAQFLLARMAYEGQDFSGALAHLEIAERSLANLDRRYQAERAAEKKQAEAEEQAFRDSLDELTGRGVDPSACSGNLLTIKKNAIRTLEERKGHLYDGGSPFLEPASYHFLRGNCLYRLGRPVEALAQYRLVLQMDPTHADAWNNLVAVLQETGDNPQARAELALAEAANVKIRPDLRRAVLGGK